MAIKGSRTTVSTVAVALNTASSGGCQLTIINGAQAIDIGDSTVAAGAGAPLVANQVVTIPVQAGDVVYAIRTGGVDSVVGVIRS